MFLKKFNRLSGYSMQLIYTSKSLQANLQTLESVLALDQGNWFAPPEPFSVSSRDCV